MENGKGVQTGHPTPSSDPFHRKFGTFVHSGHSPRLLDYDPLQVAKAVEYEEKDCIRSTIEFAMIPTLLGLSWGALLGAINSAPNKFVPLESGFSRALKGFASEIKYLKWPAVCLGNRHAQYSQQNFRWIFCSV